MDVTRVKIGARSADRPPPEQRRSLTKAQFLMWMGQEIDPAAPLYNMVHTFRFADAIDVDAFAAAWASVVAGSDTLRTVIRADEDGPYRLILDVDRDAVDVMVPVIDVRGEPNPAETWRGWVEERRSVPLPLTTRPWEVALLQTGLDETVWYLAQHHIISDAHSFAMVFDAVAERYALALDGRLDEAPELAPYEAFVEYEREAHDAKGWTKAVDHWAGKAASGRVTTDFYGRTVSGRDGRTDRLVVDIDRDRCERLREIATTSEFASISVELSRSTIWTTLWIAFIHRISGRADVRVGMPFLGRPTAAFRSTIGLFVEVGAIDATFGAGEPGAETFATLGSQVRSELFQGLRHARPGSATAELNRSYDVLVNHVTSRFPSFAGIPVDNEWWHSGHGDRDHALRIQVTDFASTGEVRLHVDVNADLFGPTERRWLLAQFDTLLDRFLEDPTRSLDDFDLLDDQQRDALAAFNDTRRDDPDHVELDLDIATLIERQVEATPNSIAVEHDDRKLSYRELDRLADLVAARLRELGVRAGERVALHLPRSIEAVIATLGVAKSGGAWVPIDPSYPEQRRRWMIDDADPVVVIMPDRSDDTTAIAGERSILHIAAVAAPDQQDAEDAAERFVRSTEPDGLAYMIYTSGSTGVPKGTMLTRRGLVNYLWWAREQYAPDGATDFALYSSLSFDLTITSLFVPLLTGGRVVVYDRADERDGLEILDVFDDDAVDVVKLTPAHLGLLREHGIAPQRIRRLVVGGENLRTDLAASIADLFPNGVEIYNEYGPTEAVVGCMIHRFDPATDTGPSVPIGTPAANARVHVLDAGGQPVPPGVSGEMVIAGDGVALGYWQRPELTAERFQPDRDQPGGRRYRTGDLARWGVDGRLEFLGRDDHQVKIRGARIELGEIESALEAHPDVDQAVVDVIAFVDEPVDGTGTLAAGLEHCITCGLPSNTPGSDFDDHNECRDCRDYVDLQDEVERYFRTPEQLRDELASRSAAAAVDHYDSLVLVSGGKDSTYMLYQLVRKYGVRPLVFLLDNGFIAERAITNVRAACADLGLDVHVATTEHMNEIFVDSLHRHANVCDGCYKTIYTLSLGLARSHGIRTIITGLARGQLFETRLADTFAAREFDPDAIDRWVMEARKTYHRIDDAVTRRLNGDLFDDDRVFDEIGFVDFYRYVDVDLDEVYAYLEDHTVWERPADTGRSTNCLINDVGIHVHNTTRGYHNYALPYSWDVRLGHKHRETAMDELDDEIDLERVRHILDEIGFDGDLDGSRSEPRLAAYYVGPPELTATDVRAHLEAAIPAHMVPTFLVRLAELPITVNGKIDRAALPDPGTGRPELGTAFVAPRTELERTLAELWAGVLPVADIGIEDDFFELGGDSITCIQVVAAARRSGLELSARSIFTERTIARIASTITTTTDGPSAGGESERVGDADPMATLGADERAAVAAAFGRDGSDTSAIDDLYPLTPVQLGMLYHGLRDPETPTYCGQAVSSFSHAELGGVIDVDRLRRAWQTVIDRHASLRTRFLWTGLDEPLQAVLRHLDAPWTTHDWRGRAAHTQQRDLDQLLAVRRRDGFDLAAGVPMTFDAVVTEERTVLAWGTHHALLDGWSAQLLHDEALAAYDADNGGRSLPAPPRPFRRYVESLRDRDRNAALDWWHATLDGVDETTPAPFARRTISGDDPHYQSRVRRLGRAESDRIATFARTHGVTVGSLTTAAWALVVAHHAGRDDVVIGATVSGREDGFDGVEDMIGMLLATVPVRLRVDDRSVATWLRDAQLAAFEARDRIEVGLADIQRVTDIPTTAALCESIVVIENYPAAKGGGVLGTPDLTITNPGNFPIAVLVHPGDELSFELVIDERYVTADEADRLALQIEHTLHSLAESPDRPITDVSVLPADELNAIRSAEFGAPLPEPDELMLDRVARHAIERPDELAVVCGASALSYADLDRRADRIAHGLAARGVSRGDAIGVAIGAGAGADDVVAMLAIWRAGATYVPLDPDLPTTRLAHMVTSTAVGLVIGATNTAMTDAGAPIVVVADELAAEGATAEPATEGLDGPVGSDVAYVIHTSGSTGVPKGVAITHSNLAHSTAARPTHYDGRVDGFLVISSLAFDSSLAGLCWALWDGGTVVLPDDDRRRDVLHFADLVEQRGVTHLLALPSVHRLLLDEVATDRLTGLAVVIVAGEACPPALVVRHREGLPTVELHNEYGPTEGTVWSHVCRLDNMASIDSDGARVPIGHPIPGASCVVLDRFGRRAPIGVPGELIIGGPGVAVGYVGRTVETAAAFVELPDVIGVHGRHYRTGDIVAWRSDGLLDYLGRVDGQVKVRGHRVELAEVEAAIESHPSIRTAVAGVDDPAGDAARRRIVVWYESDAPMAADDWRSHVVATLPAAMHPTVFVPITDWPTTSTGKIDRTALSVPTSLAAPGDESGDGSGRRHRGPSDELESTLLEVWESILLAGSNATGGIGVDDDFFDLGGNSIDAMRLFARIERRFGRDLPLATLFERPTVALLAERLRDESDDAEAGTTSNSSLVPISPHGSKRPLYLVGPHQISVLELGKIAKYFDPERPFFGLQAPGFAPGEPVLSSIPEIANHLVATIRMHQPEGPYLIGGHCDGCWTAYEMARQFIDEGEDVAFVGMVDLPPPHAEMPQQPTARRLVDRARYFWSDGRLWHALSWKVRKWVEREVTLRVGGAAARRERAVRVAHQIAFEDYELRHDHRVPIHLIRSSEMAGLMAQAPWYQQLGADGQQVTQADIESTHARLLMEPETAELAAALQERLDVVDP